LSLIFVQVFVRHLVGRVVDKHVDAAEFRSRPVNDRPTVVRTRKVASHEHAFAPSILDVARDILRILVLFQVGHQDVSR